MAGALHTGSISAIRIALDEKAFAALVRGEIAQVRGVAGDHMVDIEIILSDIGWPRMFELIRAAMEHCAA